MHILHIYKDYAPVVGGIENHLRILAEQLVKRGHRVTVLVTNTTNCDHIERRQDLTIIKAARTAQLASTPLSLGLMRYARQIHDADIVHLQFPYPLGDLAAALVPRRPPLVVTYQSDIVRQRLTRQLYAPLQRMTLSRARSIIATSHAYLHHSRWLQTYAHKCTVIPLSIDVERFAQAEPAAVIALRARYGQPLLLFVGRLRYYKGLQFLIDAMPLLRAPAQLLIGGTGPEEAALRHQVETAGLTERVHFLGDLSDEELPAVYHAANLFVLPSHLPAEALGLVLMEAQAAGLPTISTDLGTGTSYVNIHGQTGFVVPPANPRALAHAIDVLLANPVLAQKLGNTGRERCHRLFGPDRLLNQIERLYYDIIQKKGEYIAVDISG